MAVTKLKTKPYVQGNVISYESITIGAAAETLTTAGASIPDGATHVLCLPSAVLRHHPTGTPTAVWGHAILADEPFILKHADMPRTKIFASGGDQSMVLAFFGQSFGLIAT